MDPLSLSTGGGAVAVLAGIGFYVGKLLLDWRNIHSKEKRQDATRPSEIATATMSDAATANAMLETACKRLEAECDRLGTRVQVLEAERDGLRRELDIIRQDNLDLQARMDALAERFGGTKG